MRKIIGMAAVCAAMAVFTVAPAALADTSSVPVGGWVSTQTVPDYILADDGPTIAYSTGSLQFSADWNPRFGASWQDAYLVTGYSHGANSTEQAGSYGQYSYKMPLKVSSSSVVTGKMTYNTSANFVGRPGWDIWLSPNGSQGVDTSASALESNPRTIEILLQPGGKSYESNPGYDRLFYGVGSLDNVDISAYVQKALAYLGINPSGYYWAAIDGGAELTQGSFTLDSYSLSVGTATTVGGKTVTIPDWGAALPVSSGTVKKAKATTHPVKTVVASKPVYLKATPVAHKSNAVFWLWVALAACLISAAAIGIYLWYSRPRQRGRHA
jgi:hypothetical protein